MKTKLSLNLKLIAICSLFISLASCNKEPEAESHAGSYEATIQKLSKPSFLPGDTIDVLGHGFGELRGESFLSFEGTEALDESYLQWSDSVIKVIVPAEAKSGKVLINYKVSNGHEYKVDKHIAVVIIDWFVWISLAVTLLLVYLRINKIWKRKHEREVANSQSLAGMAIFLVNCVLWVCYYMFVEYDMQSIIDTSIYIFEGSLFFMIGTGIFVKGQTTERIWLLIKRALKLERKEADYLWKKFFHPQHAETIINILHQLAMIDEEMDPKELELLEAFSKEWNIKYSHVELNRERRQLDVNPYVRLRKSVENYLDSEPQSEQVAQLRDMMTALIQADEKVTPEEDLIINELMGLISNYLDKENASKQFYVIIVPQQTEHEELIRRLMPDAEKVKISGGIAFLIGIFFSNKYAEMICGQYRDHNLFTIVYTPEEGFDISLLVKTTS